jgi:hypothetical protein
MQLQVGAGKQKAEARRTHLPIVDDMWAHLMAATHTAMAAVLPPPTAVLQCAPTHLLLVNDVWVLQAHIEGQGKLVGKGVQGVQSATSKQDGAHLHSRAGHDRVEKGASKGSSRAREAGKGQCC